MAVVSEFDGLQRLEDVDVALPLRIKDSAKCVVA